MRLGTKMIAVASAAALGFGMTACGAGDTEANKDTTRIGVSVYDMSSFITAGKEGMEAYAKDNNIELVWNSANLDVSTQASQVDSYINQGVDAIIVVPVQADSLGPQVAAAKAKGIPLVPVNASLNSPDVAASVQPDDVAAGAQEMEMMAERLGGRGNIVILQGPLGQSGELDRSKGIEQTLAKYPEIRVLAKDTANWKRDEAVNKMKNWISGFGDQIDGVVAQNDDMGLGALQALKESGRTGVPIVGIDGIEDGLNAVKSGEFIGTSLQNGTVELAAGLAVANALAKGEQVDTEPVYVMPAITKDNVDVAIQHVVTERQQFLDGLSDLIKKNLETGDIAYEGIPGQKQP
ncbi:substrate-binding domain-containing protein [Mycolicibacterium phlei]|jgi:ribose transport system substrate-binding protein|uniref:LacI family transcriptional regulator n=1 Tax=Mycolicibacterium phlei DSM 43239 = CCUG 21000 TaxID=1226750 RepID=A0A5N5V036_MYCPH|nr:substrate-binding domain-containing protein [Mycolicibacterium phlei]VEG09525.1 periplasmic binding protein/LacI transcriptional regulator [Mycobacteroides chelonae]AMO61411.1 D-ribose-binding periplasmic protein precursor [Mycolicibacterium phlei]EID15419.1 periplasmic binding protein/LacI transcriptional regulator [Mycolicibacterium phlei RIVM601174]KAB7755252.1 LacI family transcriptional regulator [Mycolicibacterium phlei DSM 43239 = CCUG 21000]KXW64698.1 LacI family transcriptional reg